MIKIKNKNKKPSSLFQQNHQGQLEIQLESLITLMNQVHWEEFFEHYHN